ncbi:MAG TPA: GNAT family N-acetyltransferase [Vicinamibacterales bacterium]|nr:GNAT family N-acetyltransferase [Vicinamibacterales bacterium]
MKPSTPRNLTIRSARPSDRQFVLDLADRLVDFDVPAWRPKPELVEGDRRALAEYFNAPKPDEALYVAELDGTPAGCAYLVTLVDYFNQRPHAHLSVLAVAKHAEGKGVGSALLDSCVAWAQERHSDRLTLSALVTNSRARALYERKGFGGEYIRYVLPL